jgi:hypothetical protein
MTGLAPESRVLASLLLAGAVCLGGAVLHGQATSAPLANAGANGGADGGAGAGSADAATVGFEYENKQLQPARYRFVIAESGAGTFHSEPGDPPPADTASYQVLAEPLDRQVQLSKPVAEQIFAAARAERLFALRCEDGKNKVAFQGTKQLSYRGPEGSGSCTYNWSKTAAIEKLTATFESIAFTIEIGRRLALERKHERLALDQELGALQEAVKDGRAMEVQTIQPVLQEIAGDEAVLERARQRARKLLEVGSTTASLR